MNTIRRITVYQAKDGWRWRAQGGNWRTVSASEEGKENKSRVVAQLRRKYPDVEIVVDTLKAR